MHHLHTVFIVGSSPTVTTKFIPGLCNGSTTDFDSVSLGSIPSPGAKSYRYSIMDNTLRYERGNRGSIPFGGTNLWCL